MTRTSPLTLLAILVGGLVVGWLAELALVSVGSAVIVPPVALAAGLALLGIVIVLAAIPVRRVARGTPGARVDPFYATRVLALARTASIAAAGLTGLFGGAVIFVATRPVVADDLLWQSLAGVGAGLVLIAAGLIAEGMCAIPRRRDDAGDGPESEES